MVVVPALTAVTNPPALIVATAVLELDHVPGATALANWEVKPTQAVKVPVMG
jgi:hypothetical protein